MPDMTIDIVSDAVCPWCYVGKRRLEAALAGSGDANVAVQWRPFQLDPTIPSEGLDRQAYMRAKFRDDARLAEVHQRLKALGAEVGIKFDFAAIKRSPNTLDAHRLIRWAGEAGVQDAVVERLFSAYFERGEDIGDRDVLARIARRKRHERRRSQTALRGRGRRCRGARRDRSARSKSASAASPSSSSPTSSPSPARRAPKCLRAR